MMELGNPTIYFILNLQFPIFKHSMPIHPFVVQYTKPDTSFFWMTSCKKMLSVCAAVYI